MNLVALEDLCPGLDTRANTGYCMTNADIEKSNSEGRIPKLTKNYVQWEQEIAIPALTAAGYRPLSPFFSDAEGSSLRSRRITCEDSGGNYYNVSYGG